MAQDAARAYWRFTILWLIIGAVLGILSALSLLVPGFHTSHPLPGYGRLVSAHRASMIHGVMFTCVLATAYTLLPRLTQSRVRSGRFSRALAWIGFLIVLIGIVHVIAGMGSGREYSDLPAGFAFLFWLYLIAIAVDISLLMAGSSVMMMNPATGFLFLAAVLPAVVYPFCLPDWWGAGLFDALRVWISWRTIFFGCFTAAALGASLWYLGTLKPKPKLPAGEFLVGLGIVLTLGPLVGITHLLDTPVWPGLKVLGAFSGVVVAAGLLLLVKVLWRGKLLDASSLLFFSGLCGIGIVAIQGITLMIPPIHTAFHFTSNTSAHAHLALGSILMIFLSAALNQVPLLSKRPFTGLPKLFTASGFLVAGIFILFMFQTSAGVLQATAFINGLNISDWLPMFRWLQLGVLAGGIMAFLSFLVIGLALVTNLGKSGDRSHKLERGDA